MAGLNEEYDKVRVQILEKEDMLPLNKVVSLINREESRRRIMFDTCRTERLLHSK